MRFVNLPTLSYQPACLLLWVPCCVLRYFATKQYQTPFTCASDCHEAWPIDKPYKEMYWVFVFLIQYAVPLVVIVSLSTATVIKVKQSRARVLPSASKTDTDSRPNVLNASIRQRRRQESNMSKVLICLVILYAMSMLPQHVVFFWLTYGDLSKQKYTLYIFTIASIFPIVNSALNPLIYGSLHKELKTVFKNCLKCP